MMIKARTRTPKWRKDPSHERPVVNSQTKLSKQGPTGEKQQPAVLSSAERSVLRVFERYLMAPRKMLCLNVQDQETFLVALAHLKRRGMLLSEKMKGGYSLTQSGYAAMRAARQTPL